MLRSYKRIWTPSLLLTLATSPSVAATIAVNSTADTTANDGVCTLREAITAANNNSVSGGMAGECAAGGAGTDTIAFSIPDTDAGCSGGPPKICTIAPSSALPDIIAPVTIDGYTQPNASANALSIGDNAVIRIRLDASAVTGTALHLASGSDGSTVRGLSIVRPGGANNLGYLMKLESNNVTVTGNFIGVEPDGHTVSTNNLTFYPLWLLGTGHTVGGTTPGLRNLIASTFQAPLQIDNGGTHLVQGNYIDLDATGTVAIGSAGSGIVVEGGGGSTIGGGVAGAGNVVGTWTGAGLSLGLSSFHPGLLTAQGNLIGTDATGKVALAAGTYGIAIGGAGGTYKIGGSGAGEGNLIRGAQNGIHISADAAGGAPLIQGNHIGISFDGTQPLSCGASGINISSNSGGGLVGGTAPGEGNVIASNGTNAIVVATGTGWTILGNSIYNNGFGISLAGSDSVSAPTVNDTNDPDTGPNNRQNYPVISNVTLVSKTTVHVSGSLNSEANSTYRLEFFANAGCDKSANGQGKHFLGFTDVTTTPNDASFVSLPFTVPADRHVITATATDPNGDTSEFSLCSNQDTIFTDSFEGD